MDFDLIISKISDYLKRIEFKQLCLTQTTLMMDTLLLPKRRRQPRLRNWQKRRQPRLVIFQKRKFGVFLDIYLDIFTLTMNPKRFLHILPNFCSIMLWGFFCIIIYHYIPFVPYAHKIFFSQKSSSRKGFQKRSFFLIFIEGIFGDFLYTILKMSNIHEITNFLYFGTFFGQLLSNYGNIFFMSQKRQIGAFFHLFSHSIL
jgi:hypothetical protein